MTFCREAVAKSSFATAPTGWRTDRYDPASFGNVGTYQGRNDVLGIGIDATGDLANRAGTGQNSTFYNTQGKQTAVSGGVGSVTSADLYINAGWRDSNNGYVRTDMWAVASDSAGVTDYGIIGFTNCGGAARLRVFDGDVAGGWVDLSNAIAFGAWTSFDIELTATSLVYRVHGAQVDEDTRCPSLRPWHWWPWRWQGWASPDAGPDGHLRHAGHTAAPTGRLFIGGGRSLVLQLIVSGHCSVGPPRNPRIRGLSPTASHVQERLRLPHRTLEPAHPA